MAALKWVTSSMVTASYGQTALYTSRESCSSRLSAHALIFTMTSRRWGCGPPRRKLPWIEPQNVLSSETFRTRIGFAAAVSLVALAATSVLLVLLGDRTWRIVAAAGIWVAAAALLGWLVYRAATKERTHRAELVRAE